MDVAFLVHINITDVTTLADQAEAMSDDLSQAGYDVISVAPWSRPTIAPVSSYPTLEGLPLPPTEPPAI